jgi:hypothetical protein
LLLQVQGGQSEKPVAVDLNASFVDGQDTIGIPVEGQPYIRTFFQNGRGHFRQIGRTTLNVDARTIRLRVQDGYLGAGFPEHFGTRSPGGSERAVDHDPQSLERTWDRRKQMIRVAIERIF